MWPVALELLQCCKLCISAVVLLRFPSKNLINLYSTYIVLILSNVEDSYFVFACICSKSSANSYILCEYNFLNLTLDVYHISHFSFWDPL